MSSQRSDACDAIICRGCAVAKQSMFLGIAASPYEWIVIHKPPFSCFYLASSQLSQLSVHIFIRITSISTCIFPSKSASSSELSRYPLPQTSANKHTAAVATTMVATRPGTTGADGCSSAPSSSSQSSSSSSSAAFQHVAGERQATSLIASPAGLPTTALPCTTPTPLELR